ncbi:MAG: thioredoxin family protein [Pseudolabrys sp.]
MSTQTMTLEKTDSLSGHEVVSRSEWLIARKDLLEREKELTHFRDQVAAERRAIPWVKIEKEYTFDGPEGEVTLAELFDGRSQLFIKHFMMAPGQQTQCVGCSLEVDHTEGILPHLENHDVTYVAVARAPIEEIEAVRKRMGWKVRWVSSYHSDFNYDFNVSFTHQDAASGRAIYNFGVLPEWAAGIEDLSGDSVFYKDDAGQLFHTYSTFGRGGEEFLGIYRFLDATPKGREENGPYHSLTDWARPRNMYGKGGTVEPTGRYHQPACACEAHQSAA